MATVQMWTRRRRSSVSSMNWGAIPVLRRVEVRRDPWQLLQAGDRATAPACTETVEWEPSTAQQWLAVVESDYATVKQSSPRIR